MQKKENYTKARLIASIDNIIQNIEENPLDITMIEEIDLLLSNILDNINNSTYFIENKKARVCSFCGAVHTSHKIRFSSFHLNLLIKIFNHVVKTWNYNFKKRDIPGLSHTEYWNFYQLQRFWLLFFPEEEGKRKKGGAWGMPLKRVASFLRGDDFISEYYIRDKQTKLNIPSESKIRVFEIPKENNFTNELPDFISYEKLWNN